MSVIAVNYYKRLKIGLLTDIGEVPARWRSAVEEMMNAEQ